MMDIISGPVGGVPEVGRRTLTPGWKQLTPRLLSGTFRGFQLLKLNHDKLLSNLCFQVQAAALQLGTPALVAQLRRGGAVQVDPRFSQLTPRLLSGTSALETKL